MNKQPGLYYVLGFLLLCALLAGATGCTAGRQREAAPPLPAAAEPTLTPTPRPATATPTPAPSPTPSFVAKVTDSRSYINPEFELLKNDPKRLFLNLLQDNGGCRLPCIWSIMPLETETQASASLFSLFGDQWLKSDFSTHISIYDKDASLSIIWGGNSRVNLSLSYYESPTDQTVELLDMHVESQIGNKLGYGDPLFFRLLNGYLLPQILGNYGRPSEVTLLPIFYEAPHAGEDRISLVLLYSEQGFLIEYVFPKKTEGDLLVGCPAQSGFLNILASSPSSKPSLQSLAERLSGTGINYLSYPYYRPIEEVTSMSLDEFYEVFKEPEYTSCLQMPRKHWIEFENPSGYPESEVIPTATPARLPPP